MRIPVLLAILLTGAALSALAQGHRTAIAEPPAVWTAAVPADDRLGQVVAHRGLARERIAERNHPGHVLDLGDELGLDRSQVTRLTALEQQLRTDAAAFARQLLDQETRLAAAFAASTADAAQIREISKAMAVVEAQLRTLSLTAHRDTKAVLTPAQLARYEFLQFYTDSAEPPRS